MKKLSRLTALLLALMMLVTSMPLGALADAVTIDVGTWNEWVSSAQQAATEQENETETVTTTTTVTGTTDVVNRPVVEASLTAHAGTETSAAQSVSLPIAGKLVLHAYSGAASYQWQVKAGSQWANIMGDTGAAITLTYAKIQNAMSGSTAQVRCVMTVDGESYVSATAQVSVDESVTYTTVETQSTLTVTAEQPVLRTYARTAQDVGIMLADAGDETETEPTTVSVTIEYKFENGDSVTMPYAAQIEKGGDLVTSVIQLPEVEGYVASYVTPVDDNVTFVAPTDDKNGTIQLKLENVTNDVSYVVTYVPTYVDFTVEHYLMGLDAQQSTAVIQEEDTKVISTKKTGDAVGTGLANTYPGFQPLWYDDTTKVAADGTTKIKIYYERQWYLMLFDLLGGYGVEPIYAQYGAAVEVGTPKREGYTFLGWTLDGKNVVALPATMPAENSKYVAKWQMNDTAKVSVVIWGENPNDEEYSYLTTGELMLKPGTEYTYNGTDPLYLYCDKEEHAHNDECLTCGKEEHTQHTEACLGECTHTEHTLACYSAEYGQLEALDKQPDGVSVPSANGVVKYERDYRFTRYYLYFDGTWYQGEYSDRTVISLNCTHTHTADCYSCETHAHTAACYGCGKEEHSHDSNCTGTVEGLNSTLWKFVKSDKVTVAADGSSVINVYYDRVEYMVQFYNRYGTSEYTQYKITAKWGEFIQDEWPTVNGNSAWYVSTNSSTFQAGIQVMPVGGAKFYGPMDGSSGKAYYYVEALEGVTPDVTYQNVGYVLHHTDNVPSGTSVTIEDKYPIEGYTYYTGTSNGSSLPNAKFYYTRHKYAIEFYNPTSLLKKETGVPYQSPLSSYDWTPDASMAPAQYEPGSVKFEGWYLNPECSGEKFDFTKHTMPAGTNDGDTTLTLYANWVLVEHDVTFYIKKEDIGAEGVTPLVATFQVTHYDTVAETAEEKNITIPTKDEMANKNGNYTFVGWFYMDGEDEKAFDPDTMPVVKDLVIYGKWSATEPVPFTIHYYLLDENDAPALDDEGNNIKVADDTQSQALDGTTITVEAKTGTDLYAAYRNGYFPKPPSHSVEIDITKENNEYTFWYSPATEVPYKVVYLIEDGNGGYTEHSTKSVSDNTNVVVTENYLRIPGYMPDAFQKRLIVSYPGTTDDDGNNKTDPEKGENIIFFYYHKDTENAYWTVSHFIEPVGGVTEENDWQQYGLTESQTGKIGAEYTATAKDIEGFTLSEKYVDMHYTNADSVTKTTLTEKLPDGGMDFRLYYVRNEYPVKVQYLDKESDDALAAPELYEGGTKYDYQSQVSVTTDKTFTGYELVSENPQTLQIEVDGVELEKVEKNVITFYYKKTEVEINYVGVAPDGTLITTAEQKATIGTVTPEAEPGTDGVVTALGGPVVGSTATPASNVYKFVGWYSDADCTTPVETTWVDGTKITPQKQDTDNNAETPAMYESVTYYAKFEYNLTTLTIKKEGTVESNETFIFNVTSGKQTFRVAITGNGSKVIGGLTVGDTVTVTEETGWSNRYTPSYSDNGSITLQPTGNEITITNTKENDKWLYDEAVVHNNFGDNTAQ